MASIMDGVKIGFGMFIVLPLLIILLIVLLFTTFATGFETLILVLAIFLIFYLAAKNIKEYKGEDIVKKK